MASPQVRRSAQAATALRLAGASFNEVAETLGLAGAGEARTLVERDLAERSDDDEGRKRLRAEEAARIERVLRGVWGKAINPEDPEHLPAARTALALIDRHARLLGLDAPQEVIVYTPTTGEIDAWVAEMLNLQSALPGEVVEADVLSIEAAEAS